MFQLNMFYMFLIPLAKIIKAHVIVVDISAIVLGLNPDLMSYGIVGGTFLALNLTINAQLFFTLTPIFISAISKY